MCEPVARLLRRSEAGLGRAGDKAAAGISPFQRRRWRSALVGLGLARQAARAARSVRTAQMKKSPFVRTGLQKEKQARFPVPVAYNLAEEGGFRIALRALHLVG